MALENGRVEIQRLADEFQKQESDAKGFTNKFFFKIRERFDLLNPSDMKQPRILSDDQACALMAMEYLRSGVNQSQKPKLNMQKARERIRPLLKQCRPVFRDSNEPNKKKWSVSESLESDGALLVRFLATKGVER